MNKNALQARVNSLNKQTGVPHNTILQYFFFEEFLERLAKSKFRDNFIFKGGFLLSSILGINYRSTIDLDFLLRKESMDKVHLVNIVKEIVSIPNDKDVSFTIDSINQIREDDIYGGFHITLVGKMENIKQIVGIDIAAGDPITPGPIEHKIPKLLNEETIMVKGYNLETILSEKVETILNKGLTNSRMKDFYDVYVICKLKGNTIDWISFKKAFTNTCEHRQFLITQEKAIKLVTAIENDKEMEKRWNNYSLKNKFASDISFSDCVKALLALLKKQF